MRLLNTLLAILMLGLFVAQPVFAQGAVSSVVAAKFINIDKRANNVVGFCVTRNSVTKEALVGIGTFLPVYNLDVSGSVKLNKPVLFNIVTVSDPTAIDWRKGSVQRITMGSVAVGAKFSFPPGVFADYSVLTSSFYSTVMLIVNVPANSVGTLTFPTPTPSTLYKLNWRNNTAPVLVTSTTAYSIVITFHVFKLNAKNGVVYYGTY